MPMGVVSDEEFDLEISNKKPVIHDNVIRRPFHGRHPNDKNIPESIREIVADDSSSTGKEISQALGISQSSVSAYQHGATSTSSYDKPDTKLKEVVDRRKLRISRKSSKALLKVLDKMTDDDFDEKLDNCKAVELSTIAANMSRVVEKVNSSDKNNNVVQQNIVFYAPTPVKTDTFEIIDLGRKTIDAASQ